MAEGSGLTDDCDAFLSDDGTLLTIRRGDWVGCGPVARLDDQLRHYRWLRDRAGGKYASVYAPMVRALERVEEAV